MPSETALDAVVADDAAPARAAVAIDEGAALSVRAALRRDKGGFELDVDVRFGVGITVVFGPSGSGKSTLLNVVAGLVEPSRGRIALGDEVLFDDRRRVRVPIHQRRIAFVFQSLGLFPHLTALENVEFGIDRALPRQARRDRALACLARFRAVHLANRKPRSYSGGEGQRVALARAFAMKPRLMLLDEPFSALEDDLRDEFVRELRATAADLAICVVHVTHDRREAAALADRVLMMEKGRVVRSGTAEETLTRPTDG